MRVAFCGYRILLYNVVVDCISQGHEVVGVFIPDKAMTIFDPDFSQSIYDLNISIFESLDEVVSTNIDLLFSVNYWQKISPEIIEKVPAGIINIHHSYRLKYAGRNTCSWAIMEREINKFTHGTTIHYIDSELDRGQIISTKKVHFSNNTSAENLFEMCEKVALELFRETLPKIASREYISYIPIDADQKVRLIGDRPTMNILEHLDNLEAFLLAWGYLGDSGPYIELGGIRLKVLKCL